EVRGETDAGAGAEVADDIFGIQLERDFFRVRHEHGDRSAAAITVARGAQLESARIGEVDDALRLAQRFLADHVHVAARRLGHDFRTFARGIERRDWWRAEGEAKGIVAKAHRRRLEAEWIRMRHPAGETRFEFRTQLRVDVEKRAARSAA